MNDPTPAVPPCGVVLTTLPDETSAEALARQIVDAGLGACVQLQAIRSVYRWQGETCAEPEWRLAIKIRADRYPALEAFIRARHPYALPQIVMLPITAGAPDYLQWVAEGSAGAE